MPWLLIEPRPYSLIRAQNNEPLFFFLARTASSPSLSLQLFWRHHHSSPHSFSTNIVLPPSRLASGHATMASRCSDWTVSLSATVLATLHHHASPSSSSTNIVLPPSRLAFGHTAPAIVVAPLFPTPPFRAQPFPHFPVIVAQRFLQGKFPTHCCLVFHFVYVNFQF